MGENENSAKPLLHGIGRDLSQAMRFARSSWQDNARVIITLTQVLIDRIDGFLLVRSETNHGQASVILLWRAACSSRDMTTKFSGRLSSLSKLR